MFANRKFAFFAAVAIALIASAFTQKTASAAELKIGDVAPGWSDLVGVDDKKHSLDDFKSAKALVVVFTCNHCPFAKAYEDRLIAVAKDYKSKGVELVAINVNNIPEDRFDKMKERAKEKKFEFPYLYDPTQKVGHDYGAKVTPHVFVLDKDRKVAYVGAVDDDMKVEKAKKTYLRDALDAVLAGKAPAVTETKPVGCRIKYEKE